MNKSCIFIGSIYPKNVLDDILCEGTHADFAANTFQTGIIEGLHKLYEDVRIITSPVTSPFPKSHKLIYSKQKSEMEYSEKRLSVSFTGFINLPFIKLVSEYFRVRSTLRNKLKNGDTIYVYALHSPFLLAVYSLRKKISKVCVIVPDLPDYMSHNNGMIRRMLKSINKYLINMCLKSFQYHVLFSSFMQSELPLKGKEWIVVEGIYEDLMLPKCKKEDKKTILYTGIISSRYGVFDLIEAFHRIVGDDYQLWLCGSCFDEIEMLKTYIKKDYRIKYFGMLQKQEVRTLQACATLLVNPRHSYEEFTKFSFPSKTMEYLASGTPTLMCKLPAIPEEYNEHLFFFEDESIEGYSNRIIEICNMDEKKLSMFGEKARKFILEEKNCYYQAKRIFGMVDCAG